MVMMTMPALVGVGTFPTARAVAVSERKNATERACHEVNGLVVMTTDCDTLVLGEYETALVKDVERAAAMATPVPPASLAEVVEESSDGDTVRRDATRMGGHVFINFK